ncbi:MAG: polysaccharide export protein [Flavobacteriaceae bacterium]|nr:polysaccharide export protein [Flavobacteriaceae bacterium]
MIMKHLFALKIIQAIFVFLQTMGLKLNRVLLLFFVLFSFSCATKKDVIYLQDNSNYETVNVLPSESTIQPNDILKITVGALIPEAALPYNKSSASSFQSASIDIMKLDGYVVSNSNIIDFPIIGEINVTNKTPKQLAAFIQNILEKDGHLKSPAVEVRLLNGKFTVLGEVNKPGTYDFTETSITVFQALGLAGDLTINGQREDILLIREIDGKRTISHIDLTTTKWFDSDSYYIKPNDVLVVNPNIKQVKSSGIIGDTSTVLGVASLIISITILLTR